MIIGIWLAKVRNKARESVAQRLVVLEEPVVMRAGLIKSVRDRER